MDSDSDKKSAPPTSLESSETGGETSPPNPAEGADGDNRALPEEDPASAGDAAKPAAGDLYDPYDEYYDDPYGYQNPPATAELVPAADEKPAPPTEPVKPATPAGPPPPPPSSSTKDDDGEDDEEDMLRMSFLEHLEELRSRIIKALVGIGLAFLVSIIFANDLWLLVSEPAVQALTAIGAKPKLAQIKPMDAFMTIWVKVPILAAIFLASPWVLYQVWAFIAPGLYRRERRWAAPFVMCSAGLFILGGLFAYFVAFRFGLTFLLGIGRDINVDPVVSLTEYFDLFVNVTLGVGLVFELPVLVFFLTLLRIVTPGFLMRNARYAVLLIVILAAIVTPTPDVVNLMLFSVPMCLLYFVGVFAGYLLTLHREHRRFPWGKMILVALLAALIAAGAGYLAASRYGLHFEPHWPFLMR